MSVSSFAIFTRGPNHPRTRDGRRSTTFGIDYPFDWVYAIEVYRSYLDLPLKYRDPEGDRRCGGILIWSSMVWGF